MAKKNHKRFAVTSMAAATAIAGIAPMVASADEVTNFTDVTPDSSHYDAVQWASQNGITGYLDGSFGVGEDLSREHAAVFFNRIFDLPEASASEVEEYFDDVTADHRYAADIAAVAKAGIFSGDNGNFNPTQSLTRQQMAKTIVERFGFENTGVETGINLDNVHESYQDYVTILAQYGITTELDDFRPGETVKRQQFASFLYRAVNADTEVAPVENVSAINGKELQINFSQPVAKSTVIGDGTGSDVANTLKDGVFKFNGADGDDLVASLSEDGKTLTVVAATTWGGNTSVEVTENSVKTLDGDYVSSYFKALSLAKDTTRAQVTDVQYVNKYTYKVNFSEPVQSTGTVAAQFADGTSVTLDGSSALAADGKSYTVVFDNATDANKEITVSFPALEDFAGNISKPTTANATISDADKTKPSVSSVTTTGFDGSDTSFQIKLSEAVTETDLSGITVNGNAVVSAAVDSDDATVINATVAGAVKGDLLVYVPAAAFADLNGNSNDEVGKFYNFVQDEAAPTLASKTIERVDGVENLVLTFNENIDLSAPASLVFTSVDKYGMPTTTTIGSPDVAPYKVVDGKTKQVSISLAGLEDNTGYKLTLASGLVSDSFDNSSAELKDLSFTTSTVDTGVGTTTVATIDNAPTEPGTVAIDFDNPVNVASAEDVANYVVEDATVEKATVTSNDSTGATVVLTLAEGTVEKSGNYNVTVKAIKPFESKDTANAEKTASVALIENVRSVIKSQVLTDYQADTFTLDLAFDDATVADAGTVDDFELYVDGKATGETVAVSVTAGEAIITYTDGTDAVEDLTTANSVKLVALDTLDIKDTSGNIVKVSEIVVK
ncbi:S-layer homology domain-containing protein [Oceanobacillus massiliensis]|uniref:S-layer homology domain-containing protein n=1 Tax=Oceanobacillus massiliensis TaxID=1465765 RepID=UPI003015E490